MGKHVAACLLFISGLLIAPDLKGQPSTDILNRIENYSSSTCQIIVNGSYTCSGVLINNSQDQGRPLILTASHCLESEEDLNSAVVILGRRKIIRDQPYAGVEWSSKKGVTLVSSSRELDFALLELKSRIPDHISPVYLGWNREFTQPTSVSCIHSPDFDDAQYPNPHRSPAYILQTSMMLNIHLAWRSHHWRPLMEFTIPLLSVTGE
jgi:hypothetical protein